MHTSKICLFYLHLNIICLLWAHGTFNWSACIKPDKCAVMYFCVVGMLLCLFSQFFLLYFGTLPTVWYLFWFFIWFQIQNEWTHFTTIQFYTKHTGHPLITNSCDVQLQVEQYWYHGLSKWPRSQTGIV